MDQDATWYGGRPRPRRHCVIWGPSSLMESSTAPTFRPISTVAKAGWISIPLSTEVGLGSGDIVLDGNPAPHGKEHSSPSTFRPTLLWRGRPSQQLLSSCWANLWTMTFYRTRLIACMYVSFGQGSSLLWTLRPL